jgi:lipoprotein-anchoring transpeptidase ErfK/SrfK
MTRLPSLPVRRAVPILIATIVALLLGGVVHRAPQSAGSTLETLSPTIDLSSLRGAPTPPDPLRTGPVAPIPSPPKPALLVHVPYSLPVMSRPGGGQRVGTLTAHARYSGQPITAWVLRVSADRKFGLVPIAYSVPYRTGWIRLAGLRRSSTPISVLVDLSQHRLTVRRLGRVIMRVPVAIGSPSTPTPPGRYFVTERVPFSPGSSYGAFVFGISGIQTRLPCCGNLLAIHGTNNPSSIGRSVSAGCVRVGSAALQRLKPLLLWGTPVVIQP